MKAGVTTSVVAHALVLAWGMVSLAAPTPLQVPDVEALPIDIVPFEELTKTVQGSKKAEISDKPAPKPTKAPPRPEPAENAGETNVDKKAEAPVEEKAPPVEKTEAPAPKPKPAPAKQPTPVPTPELTPEPKPKTDIAMLLKQTETPVQEETVDDSFKQLPDQVAAPKQRPTETKPQPAETNERKVVEEVKTADTSKAEDTSKSKDDSKAKDEKPTDAPKKAVVNKAKPNAGGAKRSDEKAALGAKKSNSDGKLAQSEIDALRGRLEGCWDVGDLTGHVDAAKMRARVEFNLTRNGEIDGRVKVKVSGTDRSTSSALSVRVRSAVAECAPYKLPAEKYDTWSEVVVNFSLQDML